MMSRDKTYMDDFKAELIAPHLIIYSDICSEFNLFHYRNNTV